ncbi:VCBS repeat-containing protein [Lentzea tibetensis]|uniref:VCBS repeat-containing protein n=1 Tax=Lentzea tibetensis TaxID=2591470 RepID=A0A563EQ95_9PSEU|nr:VCBS repeat-containing protein [Lentzea tibetensis]TWP49535.1 VCBS repeat-containing protein [Lentzea tibetensis]
MSAKRIVTALAAVAASLLAGTAAAPAADGPAPPTTASAPFVLADFGFDQGWRVDRHPRFLADITGDGRADIVGFGNAGVFTAVARGDGGFGPAQFVLADFGFDQGWRIPQHPRFVTDVNGDGRADIVGIGNAGVFTAMSLGNGGFAPPQFVLAAFGTGRPFSRFFVADVNADGRNDLYSSSPRGIDIAIAQADGRYTGPVFATSEFSTTFNGFPFDAIRVADVTGDRRAELLAFRTNGPIRIVTATPRRDGSGTYPASIPAQSNTTSSPQLMDAIADITGDSQADLVAFGQVEPGSHSAVSRFAGTFADFAPASETFGAGSGWRADRPRTVVDITGDKRADIVGFGDAGVFTAVARGDGGFAPAGFVLADFGFNSGWRDALHVRLATDITGDGRADIVGFGNAGVFTAVARGDGGF